MGDRIKVLMIGPDRGVHGGISALVNTYYEAGLNKKVNLKYIGTMKEGRKIRKLFVAGLAYFKFAMLVGKCDIVHVNFSSDSSFMRKSLFIKSAKRHGKKIVLHQHGGDFVNYYENQLSDKKKQYVREILNMGDIMLVLTESWKQFFGKLVDESRIEVMPNAVVTKEIDTGADHGCKDMNSILFLGRICKDKGVKELLKAVGEIHSENSAVRLYIGGIFEEEEFRDEIDRCKDFAKYIGWVSGDEKNRYLDECGIMAVPSYFEGFGLTVVEGMLHGCCVVASNVGGIPDIIENETDGLLIPCRDSEALKKSIERVMKDKELADRLSCNGAKKAVEKYSVEKLIGRICSIYQRLI